MPTLTLTLALTLFTATAALPASTGGTDPTERQPLFVSAPCGGVDPLPGRLQTLTKWQDLIQVYGKKAMNESITYDEMSQLTRDAGITAEDYTITLSGGVVTRGDLERMPIYLNTVYDYMNLQTMKLGASDSEGGAMTIDGDTLILEGNFNTYHAGGRYLVRWEAMPIRLNFAPCSTLIQYEERRPHVGSMQTFMWNVDHSTYMGAFGICAYHDAFCVGEYKQYDNFQACLDYMETIPTVSPKCGKDTPAAGHSKGCMYIAKWSVPWRPNLCYALGPELNAQGELNIGPDSEYMCKEEDCENHEALVEAPYDIPEPGTDYLEAIAAYEKDLEDTYGLTLENYKNFPFPTGAPKPPNPEWDM